jgi:tripartite ATP-independent transporter DctP family solute receptor
MKGACKMKKTSLMILSLLMVFLLSATFASAQTITLRCGAAFPPDDLIVKILGFEFAKLVNQKSNGRVKIDVYPGGQLGDSRQLVEGLELGTIDIVLEPIVRVSHYAPLADVADIPFLIRDQDHFNKVWFGPVGKSILSKIEGRSGIRVISVGWWGERQLTTRKPVHSIDDIKGVKLRIPPLRTWVESWKRFGASPTPIDTAEAFTALRQGVIDGWDQPLPLTYSFSFHTVAKYVAMIGHVKGSMSQLMWGKKLDALPKDAQQTIMESAAETAVMFGKAIEEQKGSLIEKMKKEGVTFYYPDQNEMKKWRARLDGMVETSFPELLDEYKNISNVK